MKVYDFHAHIYPDSIAIKAAHSVGAFYAIEVLNDGTVGALLRDGQSAGITSYNVHSVATTPKQVRAINNYIAEAARLHPEFSGFGTLHAAMDEPCAEVDRIRELGLCGIKIHPDTQLFCMDDERMFPVYDYISGKLPILIHCGDYRYDYSHPSRLARVLELFPRLTVVAAHFGGWSVYDLALEYLEHKNCYVDTSSSIMYVGKRRAKELINAYGAERVLFGSDYPMWSPSAELKRFLELGLSDADSEKILYSNAAALIKRVKSR